MPLIVFFSAKNMFFIRMDNFRILFTGNFDVAPLQFDKYFAWGHFLLLRKSVWDNTQHSTKYTVQTPRFRSRCRFFDSRKNQDFFALDKMDLRYFCEKFYRKI